MESNCTLYITQGFIQALLPTLHVHLTGCDLAAPPNWLYNPLPCTLAFTGHFCRWTYTRRDAAGSKLVPRRSTPVYFSILNKAFFGAPSGTGAERLGVRTAWNTIRHLLVNHGLHFRKDEDEEFASHHFLPASSMWSKRLSVKSGSTLKCAPPLITRDSQASAAMRVPAVVVMEAMSTILLILVNPPGTREKDGIQRAKNEK